MGLGEGGYGPGGGKLWAWGREAMGLGEGGYGPGGGRLWAWGREAMELSKDSCTIGHCMAGSMCLNIYDFTLR